MSIIMEFIKKDSDELEDIIAKYPNQIPVPVAADFLHMDKENLRAVLESGKLGLAWRKNGKLNHGYCIPTGKFVRWYIGWNEGERSESP